MIIDDLVRVFILAFLLLVTLVLSIWSEDAMAKCELNHSTDVCITSGV